MSNVYPIISNSYCAIIFTQNITIIITFELSTFSVLLKTIFGHLEIPWL